MRFIWLPPLALAALSTAALAQEDSPLWQAHAQWFQAAFGAPPRVAPTRYAATGAQGQAIAVPATAFSRQEGGASYKVTVAQLAGTPAQADHALDYAIAHVRALHPHLALDAATSHSYGNSGAQACGRQFGYLGQNGRLIYQTLFYNERTGLFYDIRSSVAATDQAEHGADVVHFQQSFALLPDPGAKADVAPDAPGWQTFSGPEAAFSIRFPSTPAITQSTYRTAAGLPVPATVYEVKQENTIYRLTAVHLWQTAADTQGVLDREIARWQHRGRLARDAAVAIPAGQCGRDIALRDSDGSDVHTTLFFPSSQHRLYIIETRSRGAISPKSAIEDRRFRQSFAVAKPE